MTARLIRFAALVLTAALVSSCANELAAANPVVRADDGPVEAIETYRASDNKPDNVGTVLGGIAGGVIGHQIGSGRGNTGATIAGAIGRRGTRSPGGAESQRLPISDHDASGLGKHVENSREVDLRVGDRVRVEDDSIEFR